MIYLLEFEIFCSIFGEKTSQTSVFFLCLIIGVSKYLALSMLCQCLREESFMALYVTATHVNTSGQHNLIFKNSLQMLNFWV